MADDQGAGRDVRGSGRLPAPAWWVDDMLPWSLRRDLCALPTLAHATYTDGFGVEDEPERRRSAERAFFANAPLSSHREQH
jgi:hypothetical protein